MATPFMDFKQMKQNFHKLDSQFAEINKRVSVIVVGTSSLIFADHSGRRTEDIDVVNNRERLFYHSGFHLLEEHFLMLHPEYKKRLHRVWPEMAYLEVYRIDVYDLFLNKFNASRAKDLTDMLQMIEQKMVTREICTPLFEEWLEHWFNSDEKLRKEYEKLWR